MNRKEQFCLKWNDFSENMISTFSYLRTDQELTDVTLVCEDGTEIEAHKLVLTAGSTFFKNIFKNKRKGTPIIYMRGLKSSNLSAIKDFMYFGEVNIQKEELDTFLSLADELQIRGLADSGENNKETENKEQMTHRNVTPNPRGTKSVGSIKEESSMTYEALLFLKTLLENLHNK